MSLNIKVISEGIFLSLFLAYSTVGMSLKLQFYYKRWTERATSEGGSNRSYAGSCVKPGLYRGSLPGGDGSFHCGCTPRGPSPSLAVPRCPSPSHTIPCRPTPSPLSALAEAVDSCSCCAHATVESLFFTYLFPANCRKGITFDTTSIFFLFFFPLPN